MSPQPVQRSLSSAHLVNSCSNVQAFIIGTVVLMKGHGKVGLPVYPHPSPNPLKL